MGDPGSTEILVSREDFLFATFAGPNLSRVFNLPDGLPPRLREWAFRLAQFKAQRLHRRMRIDLLRQDRQRNEFMAFSGPPE